jgi:hypothetical protein
MSSCVIASEFTSETERKIPLKLKVVVFTTDGEVLSE